MTLHDTDFFDQMQDFSGNEAGTGGLVTFKDGLDKTTPPVTARGRWLQARFEAVLKALK